MTADTSDTTERELGAVMTDPLFANIRLSDPHVVEAKRVWKKQKKDAGKLNHIPFEEWFHYFQSHASLSDVAKKCGVRRQRVHQIYTEHFEAVFRANGNERAHVIHAAQTAAHLKHCVKRALDNDAYAFVFQEAHRAQLTAESVLTATEDDVDMSRVRINNVLCALHYARQHMRSKTLPTPYARTVISRSTLQVCAYVIVHTHVPGYTQRCFVLPCTALTERYFAQNTHTCCHAILPLVQPKKRHTSRFKIDWWQYADAWRLMKET